jgi:hypothetical protein
MRAIQGLLYTDDSKRCPMRRSCRGHGIGSLRFLHLALLGLWLLASGDRAAFAGDFDHSHAAFSAILSRHVRWNEAGTATTVDYAALQRERASLDGYTRGLSLVSPAEFARWGVPQRRSFLINAYNAFTLQHVLSRYPRLGSIRDLGNIVFDSPWKQRFFDLLGERRHLDDLEHGLLRGAADFDEPRIHFAVNCASVGCPALRPEAYRAERLEAQLEDQTRRFLRDRSRNRFEAGASATAWVSPIFKWYGEDFAAGHRGAATLREFLAAYADALADSEAGRKAIRAGGFAVKFTPYSWALNDARPSAGPAR